MSFVDPYIDTETGLLINSIGAKTQSELDQIEADFVSIGLLKLYDEKFRVSYSLEDLQYIHASLFGKVYPWAGQIRTVEIHKVGDPDNSNFAPSALIEPAFYNSMQELGEDHNLQGLNQLSFADRLAYHFSNVNYNHPFREGNGRTQRVFWSLCAMEAGYDLDWTSVSSRDMDSASKIARLNDDLTALKAIFKEIAIPFNKNSSLPIDAVYKRLLRVRNHLSMQADRTYDLTEKYIR